MRTLKEDWDNFKSWDATKTKDIKTLRITGVEFYIKALDDAGRFMIGFYTPFGNYSLPVTSYENIYDSLGQIFCEEDGIIDNMFNMEA